MILHIKARTYDIIMVGKTTRFFLKFLFLSRFHAGSWFRGLIFWDNKSQAKLGKSRDLWKPAVNCSKAGVVCPLPPVAFRVNLFIGQFIKFKGPSLMRYLSKEMNDLKLLINYEMFENQIKSLSVNLNHCRPLWIYRNRIKF